MWPRAFTTSGAQFRGSCIGIGISFLIAKSAKKSREGHEEILGEGLCALRCFGMDWPASSAFDGQGEAPTLDCSSVQK